MEVSKFDNKSFINTPAMEGCDIIEELHTKGGTCNTFRAKIYGKLIFIKRLKPEFAGNTIYREALHKEFETGFRLEHPNLARYIALKDDSLHIEYVDGETLSERLRNNPQYFKKQENCNKFIRQLLSAIQYLHGNQVVHLDIKPDNILLTRINNDVKLVDLGFCRTDCFSDTTGHTEPFAAPEQLNGTGIDERSDIYAVGRIIELLPNRHIYNKVIARCTAKNKDERYQSVNEIVEEISKSKNKPVLITLIILLGIAIVLLFLGLINSLKTTDEKETTPYNEKVTTQKETEQFKSNKNISKKETTPYNEKVATQKETEQIKSNKNIGKKETTPYNEKGTTQKETEQFKSNKSISEKKTIPYYEREATQEEFELFKERLSTHYKAVTEFVSDSTNLQKYPSYISYCTKYKELLREAVKSMHKDEWTYNGFKSIMNPLASYRREFLERLDSLQRNNADKLP